MKSKESTRPVKRNPWEVYQDGRYWKVQGVEGSFANEPEARKYASLAKTGNEPPVKTFDSRMTKKNKSKKVKFLDSDILIRVPLKLRQDSKALAKRRGFTLSELIRALLAKEVYKG